MKFLRITLFHFKRFVLQSPQLLLMTFVFPLVLISAIMILSASGDSSIGSEDTVIVSQSSYFDKVIYPMLDPEIQEKVTIDEATAFDELGKGDRSMVYVIPKTIENLEDSIKVYSLSGQNNDAFVEQALIETLQKALVETAYKEVHLEWHPVTASLPSLHFEEDVMDSRLMVIVFMTVFFMSYSAGIIAGELLKMKNSQVLTRSIVTNSTSWHVLGSLLAAYALYNFFASVTVIGILCLLFDIHINQPLLIIACLLAFCIFNVGYALVLFRLLKNEQLVQVVGIFTGAILMFMGMGLTEGTPIEPLQYLTPFYWLSEALDTGVILKNIGIVILYGIVLFTAGSFKVERLVKA